MKLLSPLFNLIPCLTVLVMVLGGCLLRFGEYPLLPALFLIPIFYWLIFRPDLLPLWCLFIIGLYYDGLLGHELGLTSLLLISSAFLSSYMRPYLSPHNFLLTWGTFCIYSLAYICLFCLLSRCGISLLLSWLYGVILYPLVSWTLSQFHVRIQKHV